MANTQELFQQAIFKNLQVYTLYIFTSFRIFHF